MCKNNWIIVITEMIKTIEIISMIVTIKEIKTTGMIRNVELLRLS